MSGEQGIHIVADAIAEVVTDDAYAIQPGNQNIAIGCRQLPSDFGSLFGPALRRALRMTVSGKRRPHRDRAGRFEWILIRLDGCRRVLNQLHCSDAHSTNR